MLTTFIIALITCLKATSHGADIKYSIDYRKFMSRVGKPLSDTISEIDAKSLYDAEIVSFLEALTSKVIAKLSADTHMVGNTAPKEIIFFIGDTHGSLDGLAMVLHRMLRIDGYGRLYLVGDICFLGDFVDRGSHQLEVLCLALALYIRFPDRITFIGGNHETEDCTSRCEGSFKEECRSRCGGRLDLYDMFVKKVFPLFPLFAIHNGLFCVHGMPPPCSISDIMYLEADGYGGYNIRTVDTNTIGYRACQQFGDNTNGHDHANDCLWGDVREGNFGVRNGRLRGGGTKEFGQKAYDEFATSPIVPIVTDGATFQISGVRKGHLYGDDTGSDHLQNDASGGTHALFGGLVIIIWTVRYYGRFLMKYGYGVECTNPATADEYVLSVNGTTVKASSTDTGRYIAMTELTDFSHFDQFWYYIQQNIGELEIFDNSIDELLDIDDSEAAIPKFMMCNLFGTLGSEPPSHPDPFITPFESIAGSIASSRTSSLGSPRGGLFMRSSSNDSARSSSDGFMRSSSNDSARSSSNDSARSMSDESGTYATPAVGGETSMIPAVDVFAIPVVDVDGITNNPIILVNTTPLDN
jgi:hypothetical protein